MRRLLAFAALLPAFAQAQTFTPIATDDFESYSVDGQPGTPWEQKEAFNCYIYIYTGKYADASHSGDNCLVRRDSGTYSASQYSQAKYTARSNGSAGRTAVCVRVSADTFSSGGMDAYCGGVYEEGTQQLIIWKLLDNMRTELASTTGSVADNDIIKISVDGTAPPSLTFYVNGSPIGALTGVTDGSSPITGAGRPGFFAGITTATDGLDNWEGGDFSPGSSNPSVTSVTPSTFVDTATGIVIGGSNFEASQGMGGVKICPTDNIMDANCSGQTETSWGTSSITFTAVKGANSTGVTAYLFVTNNTGNSNASGFNVQFSSGGGSASALSYYRRLLMH